MIINLNAKNKADWVSKVRAVGAILQKKGYLDTFDHLQHPDDEIKAFYPHYIGIRIYEDKSWLYAATKGEWDYDDVWGLFDIFS